MLAFELLVELHVGLLRFMHSNENKAKKILGIGDGERGKGKGEREKGKGEREKGKGKRGKG
ncbi:hypothetical protein VF10_30095, partial [Nostoc linckia z13]